MSTPTRSIFSASIGPALTLSTAVSAYVNGPLAAMTTVAFGLTVVWGIVEIALLSYTPIASIDLDGPSALESEASHDSARLTDTASDKIVPFSDPNPEHARRAA
ncbi:MAG: hypothetical protein IAE82_02755 [Opitutaceae bacterium]|nr:hypothetical protein [Opitutaceae bacterium]